VASYIGDVVSTGIIVAVDISDPAHPSIAGTLTMDDFGYPRALAISGNYLYASLNFANFVVIDVADPTHMTVAATLPLDSPYNVTVSGNYAYVFSDDGTNGVDTLYVINIGTPTSPTVVGTLTDARLISASGQTVSGNRLFALNNTDSGGQPGEFVAVDISDPANPAIITAVPNAALTWDTDVAVSGSFAFATSGHYDGTGGNSLVVFSI